MTHLASHGNQVGMAGNMTPACDRRVAIQHYLRNLGHSHMVVGRAEEFPSSKGPLAALPVLISLSLCLFTPFACKRLACQIVKQKWVTVKDDHHDDEPCAFLVILARIRVAVTVKANFSKILQLAVALHEIWS
jgi:hypothetical protein